MIEEILTEEQIDGTNLTENPDIQYRRMRLISKPKKWKRSNKVKEMLNYCKYKVGEIDTCSKVPAVVYTVLSNYKRGRFDLIGSGYMEAINTYKDLIDRAIKIRGNNSKRKENKMEVKTEIKNKQNINANFKAKRRLTNWLSNICSNELLISPRNNTYTMHFVTFKNGRGVSYLPRYIGEVLSTDLGQKVLKNYHHSNGRLIRNTINQEDEKEFFKYIKENGPLDNAVLTENRMFKINNTYTHVDALYGQIPDDGTKKALEILQEKRENRKKETPRTIENPDRQEDRQEDINGITVTIKIDNSISLDDLTRVLNNIGVKEFLINF